MRVKRHFVVVVVVAVAALALAGVARADWTLGPTATGMSRDIGGGNYDIAGMYADQYAPNGFGRYSGTINAPGDFTSCRDVFFCTPDVYSHCNLASGQVTFQSGLRLVTVFIAKFGGVGAPRPVVCQLPGTTTRVYSLTLVNQWTPNPPQRGYGPLLFALGFVDGTSAPRNDAIYEDNLDFSLNLVPPA